jgi:hypothetical protein
MNVTLYQMKDTPECRKRVIRGIRESAKVIVLDDYNLVWTGFINPSQERYRLKGPGRPLTDEEFLNILRTDLSIGKNPLGYHVRSLCPSDVVSLDYRFYSCRLSGWKLVTISRAPQPDTDTTPGTTRKAFLVSILTTHRVVVDVPDRPGVELSSLVFAPALEEHNKADRLGLDQGNISEIVEDEGSPYGSHPGDRPVTTKSTPALVEIGNVYSIHGVATCVLDIVDHSSTHGYNGRLVALEIDDQDWPIALSWQIFEQCQGDPGKVVLMVPLPGFMKLAMENGYQVAVKKGDQPC